MNTLGSTPFRWRLTGLLLAFLFLLNACVVSDKSHNEKVRTVTLTDFAGTYKNRLAPYHEYYSTSLADVVWPKHPPASSTGPDYRSIDRVRVAVDGMKVTLTFLIRGRVFDQVTYEEGKDFRLSSNSTVTLKTETGAAATTGQGGEEMEGMIPVLPVAGAIVQTGNLFLNPKGDIVVRLDSTATMMVFFVAPAVVRKGQDLVFERVNEEEDRRTGYGQPLSTSRPTTKRQ